MPRLLLATFEASCGVPSFSDGSPRFFSCFFFPQSQWGKWSFALTNESFKATPSALGKQLHRAVRENDRGGALEALDAGADPNWTNPSTSTCALHIACKLGHTKIALLLLQRGAEVNTQTKTGWIPMHFAVNTGLPELVELLNSYGGRADIVNEWMKTPLDIAKERRNDEMLEILKRRPGVAPVLVSPTPRTGSVTSAPAMPAAAVASTSPAKLTQSSTASVKVPAKSPRSNTIAAPTQDAPLPPVALSKPLPATPTELEGSSSSTSLPKGRSVRGGAAAAAQQMASLERGSGAEWTESSPPNVVATANVARSKGSGSVSGQNPKGQDAEIARLNQEVASLKGDVEYLKQELAKVLTYLQGVDL